MKRSTIHKVIVPIICALIGAAASSFATSYICTQQNLEQNAEIGIQISNVLNANSIEVSTPSTLEETMIILLDEYENVVERNENHSKAISDLQNDVSSLQASNNSLSLQNTTLSEENAVLSAANVNLVAENEKLKEFLLKDNTYAEDVDDLVVIKTASDRLEDLYVVDGMNYEIVDGFKDLYGDSHSVSYKLRADDIAWMTFRLAGEYDIFNANVATTQETGRNVQMSVEVYVDDVLVKRVDSITRDTNLAALGPIVVTNGNILKIKVITLEGNSDYSYCYITDDSLSVVE